MNNNIQKKKKLTITFIDNADKTKLLTENIVELLWKYENGEKPQGLQCEYSIQLTNSKGIKYNYEKGKKSGIRTE